LSNLLTVRKRLMRDPYILKVISTREKEEKIIKLKLNKIMKSSERLLQKQAFADSPQMR